MKAKTISLIVLGIMTVLILSNSAGIIEEYNEDLKDDYAGTRGTTRGASSASDIKVDVMGVQSELYNLAGIGGNRSAYSLFYNRNFTHQYLSSNDSAFYDTVWHPNQQYSLVVGANHSYSGSTPSYAPAVFKYEGATYTDLCDLTVFDEGDWLMGVDFEPNNGTFGLTVGDWGGVWKYFDGNTSFHRIRNTTADNVTFYDVEFYSNGTRALIVGYNYDVGGGAVYCWDSGNDTVWLYHYNTTWDFLRCITINQNDVALIGDESGRMISYNANNATFSLINDTTCAWHGCDWNRAGTNATFVGNGSTIYSTNGTLRYVEVEHNATNRTLWDVAWNLNDSYALVVGARGWVAEWDGAGTYTNVSDNVTNITYYSVNWCNVNFTYSGIYQYISTVIVVQIDVSSGAKSGIAVNFTIDRLGITYHSGSGTTDSYGNCMWEWSTNIPSGVFYTVRAWVTNKATISNTTQVGIVVNPGIFVYFQNAPESLRLNEWTCEMHLFSNSSLFNVSSANFTLQINRYRNRAYTNLYAKNTATDQYGHYMLTSGPTLTAVKYALNNYYMVDIHFYNHTGESYGSDDVKVDWNGSSGSPNSDRGQDADKGPGGVYRPLWTEEGHWWYYIDENGDGAYTVTSSTVEPLKCINLTHTLYLVGSGTAWLPLSSATNWLSLYWVDNGTSPKTTMQYDEPEDIYLDSGDGKLNVTGSYPDTDGFDGTYFLSSYHCFKVTTPATATRSQSVTVNLTAGWNLVGMPEGMTTAVLTAKSTHIYSILHRTAGGTSGYYVAYTKAVGITAFTMTKFEGVFIYTNQTCSITFTETIA